LREVFNGRERHFLYPEVNTDVTQTVNVESEILGFACQPDANVERLVELASAKKGDGSPVPVIGRVAVRSTPFVEETETLGDIARVELLMEAWYCSIMLESVK